MQCLAQPLELVGAQSQRLADIAQCTFRAVADDGGCQGGALAAVFFVDVLNHFLAPLVFEVHVDIRWFIALSGNEALEQGFDARGIHFGDTQAVADCGIGG